MIKSVIIIGSVIGVTISKVSLFIDYVICILVCFSDDRAHACRYSAFGVHKVRDPTL